MSAIYLVCDLEGHSREFLAGFEGLVTDRITAYPGKALDVISAQHFCGAASHHGVLPSGGIAERDEGIALVTGSCWSEPDSPRMDTPDDLAARWGAGDVDRIPQMAGLFSFAWFDKGRRELVVESDQFGSMPLYYRQEGSKLAVASEIKFLTRPGEDKADPEAVAELVELGFMSRFHTPIAGIKRVPVRSRLRFGPSGLDIKAFPVPTYRRNRELDRDALEEYDQTVRTYLGRFTGTSDRFSIALSGGLDSRLVAYAAKREGMRCEAFTTGERSSLDTVVARQLADQIELPIHFHKIRPQEMPDWFGKMTWFTEGRVHPGHMHYMSVNLHREVPPGPLLHGMGLESMLGGHFELPDLFEADGEKIRKFCLKSTTGLNFWPVGSRDRIFRPAFREAVGGVTEGVSEELFDRIGFTGSYEDSTEYRNQFKGIGWANPCLMSQALPWSDVVNPFHDHHAHRFSATIRSECIANRAGQIKWGQEYFPGFADIPRVKSGVLMPIGLEDPQAYDKGIARLMREAKIKYYLGRLTMGRVNLPMKNSFPQYWQWYPSHRGIREYVDGILLSDRTLDRGFYDREGVRQMLHDCRIGRRVWNAIGSMLIAEMFLRQFVDGTDIPEERNVPWGM